jgi:hypothetical protein
VAGLRQNIEHRNIQHRNIEGKKRAGGWIYSVHSHVVGGSPDPPTSTTAALTRHLTAITLLQLVDAALELFELLLERLHLTAQNG